MTLSSTEDLNEGLMPAVACINQAPRHQGIKAVGIGQQTSTQHVRERIGSQPMGMSQRARFGGLLNAVQVDSVMSLVSSYYGLKEMTSLDIFDIYPPRALSKVPHGISVVN